MPSSPMTLIMLAEGLVAAVMTGTGLHAIDTTAIDTVVG